jgi:Uma2 family endonuclease
MPIDYQNLTVEEYFRVEEASEERHEYVDGKLRLMVGATQAHYVITENFHALLREHLKGSNCRAFRESLRLQVEAANCYYYPDVMVSCEPFEPTKTYKQNAVLVAETLSGSTAAIDEREKLANYRKLESLSYYLLIDQRQQQIKLYKETADEKWELTVLGSADELILELLPDRLFRCAIAEIYEGVFEKA